MNMGIIDSLLDDNKTSCRGRAFYEEIIADLEKLPFSFTYGGRAYCGFPSADFEQVKHEQSETAVRRGDVFTLRNGCLEVTLDCGLYPAFGGYEWRVWFANVGNTDTAVIAEVCEADMEFSGERPILKGILGDHHNYYEPYEKDLSLAPVKFCVENGRTTHRFFPYFNIEHGNGGTFAAIGWGGTWEAEFEVEQGSGATTAVHFTARTALGFASYLKPGEKIRTGRMFCLPYDKRDEDYATNLWRRWFIQCNMPRLNRQGDEIQPFSTTWLAGDTGIPNSDGSISECSTTWRPSLEKMLSEKIRPTYRWFDAGWYFSPDGRSLNGLTWENDWWPNIGSWELDTKKWPGNSFWESTDFARAHGMKTLVWFEPERTRHLDALIEHHGYRREWAICLEGVIINNIGHPDCLEWTAEKIISFLDKQCVEMYREDLNTDDLARAWQKIDESEGPNRSGIGERKAVAAHYALWDKILAYCARTGKDSFVDSCASGGGRNDLDSLQRGVPILRSDADRTSTALRLSMTTTFNKWIPFNGASCTEQVGQVDVDGKRDKYILRASYLPILNLHAQWVQDPTTDFDFIRWAFAEWDSVKHYTLADFYVLTPWNHRDDKSHWTSFAYFDPAKDSGILLAFRQEAAAQESFTAKLDFLAPTKTYKLRDADLGDLGEFSGLSLADDGFTIHHTHPRSATLIYIGSYTP